MSPAELQAFLNAVGGISAELQQSLARHVEVLGGVVVASALIDAAMATLIASGYSRVDVAAWLAREAEKLRAFASKAPN